MNEFQRIRTYFKPLSEGFAGAFGLGDDAAKIDVPAGQELVATVDAMVENVHFRRDDGPQSIARRLMRSNLSDLAAMGAESYVYLLVTSLPKDIGEGWLKAFSDTFGEEQKIFGGHLAGGDSTRTDGPITLSLTALGLVPKGQIIRRKTQAPVTKPLSLYVSGTIGDSALGLLISQGRTFPELTAEEEAFLTQRHFMPMPRLDVARAIRGYAVACIDISDGLAADIGHIAEQSEAHAVIKAAEVPLSEPARKLLKTHPDLLLTILTGGEDYELAFALDAEGESALQKISIKLNTPLTKIGTLNAGKAGEIEVVDEESHTIPLKQKGWIHF